MTAWRSSSASCARPTPRASGRARQRATRPAEATPVPAKDDEDSFSRILGDVRDELAERLSEARQHPAVRRVNDLIDGLDDLSSRL